MNPEIKKQWVAALRSGEYVQGQGNLLRGDKYCCWGVLCDLYIKTLDEDKKVSIIDLSNNKYNSMPNDTIHNWAGTPIKNIDRIDTPFEGLAEMNDGQKCQENGDPHTFLTIADYIEESVV